MVESKSPTVKKKSDVSNDTSFIPARPSFVHVLREVLFLGEYEHPNSEVGDPECIPIAGYATDIR